MPITPEEAFNSKKALHKAFDQADERLLVWGQRLVGTPPESQVLTFFELEDVNALGPIAWETFVEAYRVAGWAVTREMGCVRFAVITEEDERMESRFGIYGMGESV